MNKQYIPVLCCSSSKTEDWFYYNGQPIKFVADPHSIPPQMKACRVEFYKPDDTILGEQRTWRDLVLEQAHPSLVPAYRLYQRDIYRNLYYEFGNHFYILSAGWGIIRAEFKIPAYDITYSTSSDMPKYTKRVNDLGWRDSNHLQEDYKNFAPDAEIILFAGAAYVPHFCNMVHDIPCRKKIYYNSQYDMQLEGFDCVRYFTTNTRQWVYEAAENFLNDYRRKKK